MPSAFEHDVLTESIVKALAYYDIFNYPLRAVEVYRFLSTNHVSEADVKNKLLLLQGKGLIYEYDNFYSLQNNEGIVERRKKGNKEAEKYLEVAKDKARLIMHFPFVRAVFASGSLSKEYMDGQSDIDFFIVTEPQRLWIARFLLGLYKKVFLLNSGKQFCLNYYVDYNHLEIEEQNLFTATELATALPLQGSEYYLKMVQSNTWLMNFFPNYQPRPTENVPPSTSSRIQRFLEALINFVGHNRVDSLLMGLFLKRWKKLHQHNLPMDDDFKVAFKTKRQVSKSHPKHYQKKVLTLYAEKLEQLKIKLSSIH